MTDPVPFRLAVIQYLVTEISSRVDDVADAMFYGRYRYGANDPLPMGSLLEDPRIQEVSEEDEHRGSSQGTWRLLLQGFVEDDADNPTKPAYMLVANFQQAVAEIRESAFTDDSILSTRRKVNRVEAIMIGKPIVRPPDEFSDKAYCWLPLTLTMIEDPANPFT